VSDNAWLKCVKPTNSFLALLVSDVNAASAREYGMSLWGQTAKITVKHFGEMSKNYFLKVSRDFNGQICTAFYSVDIVSKGCVPGKDWPDHDRGRIQVNESYSCSVAGACA
jgi:hypothetical protein